MCSQDLKFFIWIHGEGFFLELRLNQRSAICFRWTSSNQADSSVFVTNDDSVKDWDRSELLCSSNFLHACPDSVSVFKKTVFVLVSKINVISNRKMKIHMS